MRNNFVWFSHLVIFSLCAFLFLQNRMIKNELALLRSENPRTTVQTREDFVEERSAQPNEPDRELLRLRNEIGLLREQVDSLKQERLEIRRESFSQVPRDDKSQGQNRLTIEEQEKVIEAVKTSLVEGQEELAKAKSKYLELSKTLNVPESILNMEASAAFKDPRLEQYWPYFEAQKELENCGRIVDAIGLKLAAEKIDRAR